VDLSSLARKVATELQSATPGRRVQVLIADGVVANADYRLLQVVLENLLGNAWKFTTTVAEAIIEFGVSQREGIPTYFVRDNGAGFDMAYAGKLFTPFQRLHTEAAFPGTGIGLATVHRIVDRHGGRVWAESAVERGATFLWTLPTPRPGALT
jgi:light-regulated signal transduction histidine kinase (bacteriophytochrome)